MVVEADAVRPVAVEAAAVEARARRVPVRYDEAGRRGARKCSGAVAGSGGEAVLAAMSAAVAHTKAAGGVDAMAHAAEV